MTHWYEPSDGDPPWLAIANEELQRGVREIRGPEDNPRILEYHAATKLHATDDETPWCAAFVGWVLIQCGIEPSGSAAARSYLGWGVPLLAPKRGCVVVFTRPPSKTSGHVAFWLGETSTRVLCLGGNQGNSVSVATYPRERVIGYRWPSTATSSP